MRRAILDAEQSAPRPQAIFEECLGRGEYRRAREILNRHDLDAQSRARYEEAVIRERSRLEGELRVLELEIEDAFLLGQLREDAEKGESIDDPNYKALERSQLLGVVRKASVKLHGMSESEADGLREITQAVGEVSRKVRDMASSRRELLRREFGHIMNQLPKTEQGRADREYLHKAFEECIESNDDVAAFDLLDRGRRVVQGIEPVARASIGRARTSNAS